MSYADGDDAIDPIVLRGAGFEDGTHAEIVTAGVYRFALIELFDDVRRTGAQACVRHDDQGAIRRFELKPDVELDARIGAHGLPVIATNDFAGEALALE